MSFIKWIWDHTLGWVWEKTKVLWKKFRKWLNKSIWVALVTGMCLVGVFSYWYTQIKYNDFLGYKKIVIVNTSYQPAVVSAVVAQDFSHDIPVIEDNGAEQSAPTIEKPTKWVDGRDREIATITKTAEQYGFEDAKGLLRLAHCESRFDNSRTNVNKSGTKDRGIFQFNDKWHPEVSEKCARDTVCATQRVIELVNAGQINQWMCGHAYKNPKYNYLAA